MDYHVDSSSGNDSNIGTSQQQAWKTLQSVNAKIFQSGDRVLLKAGTHYDGQLSLQGSGKKDAIIELTRDGDGPDPQINGLGKSLDTLLLHNVQYWFVHGLEITNHGDASAPFRTGVRIESDAGQACQGIHLADIYVHDVNGDLHKDNEGCGIFFDSKGRGSCYDDLLIEKCHIVRTDRNGLCQRSSGNTRSTHIILRNNLLEDIGGDGIKLWGTNGGLVEHNTLHGGRVRCDDYAAGIWPFACDDCVIQYNEVSGMKGTKDGQGFDSDYVCKNNIFQYNYSHDNDGGFMLICSPGSSYCKGTIIRYNISQNDGIKGSRIFHFGGNSSDTLVYNNVIYIGADQELPLLDFDEWSGGSAHHTTFTNNIFYCDGKATYNWGKSIDNRFDSNIFYGRHQDPPNDPHGSTVKPALIKPGSGGDGFASLGGYRWQAGAQIPKGISVPNNGGKDFFGDVLPPGRPPVIGVSQETK